MSLQHQSIQLGKSSLDLVSRNFVAPAIYIDPIGNLVQTMFGILDTSRRGVDLLSMREEYTVGIRSNQLTAASCVAQSETPKICIQYF
jgi:hypothetical protein